jgi:hypothetical protein
MTNKGNAKCHFCQGPATNMQQDKTWVETEQADGSVAGAWEIEILPIDADCNEDYYDGAKMLPLV